MPRRPASTDAPASHPVETVAVSYATETHDIHVTLTLREGVDPTALLPRIQAALTDAVGVAWDASNHLHIDLAKPLAHREILAHVHARRREEVDELRAERDQLHQAVSWATTPAPDVPTDAAALSDALRKRAFLIRKR